MLYFLSDSNTSTVWPTAEYNHICTHFSNMTYRLTTPQQYDLLLNTTTCPLQQYDLLLYHASTVWPTVEYNHVPSSAVWPIALPKLKQYDLLLNTTTYLLQQYEILLDHTLTVWPTVEYNHIPTSAIWLTAGPHLNSMTYCKIQPHTHFSNMTYCLSTVWPTAEYHISTSAIYLLLDHASTVWHTVANSHCRPIAGARLNSMTSCWWQP